jgi:hypothetical protein
MTRATSNAILFTMLALQLTLAAALWMSLPNTPPSNGFCNVSIIRLITIGEDLTVFDNVRSVFALLGSLFIYALHALMLNNIPQLGTHTARIAGLAFFLLIPIPFWKGCLLLHAAPNNWAIFIIIFVLMLALMPGVVIISQPATLPGTLPLLPYYLLIPMFFLPSPQHSLLRGLWYSSHDVEIIALPLLDCLVLFTLVFFAYIPLAGYLFPRHRRLRALWRPEPLPRLDLMMRNVDGDGPRSQENNGGLMWEK